MSIDINVTHWFSLSLSAPKSTCKITLRRHFDNFFLLLEKMAVIIEIDKNSGYAGQILTNMFANDDLRDLKLVAEFDKQK